jgi:hypothetical protein
MKRRAGWFRRAAVAALVMISVVGGLPGPARAAWPTTPFEVCWDSTLCASYAEGDIAWYNRTAGIAGTLVGPAPDPEWLIVRARFDAYKGTKKIDEDWVDSAIPYSHWSRFVIGDTNLVGGINRIKITVCVLWPDIGWTCGSPKNYYRP